MAHRSNEIYSYQAAVNNTTTSLSCPGKYLECKEPSYSYSLEIDPYIAVPALISCVLSCIGSVLIVYTYCRWKDIRTGSRSIIMFLSIADFFTAFGYIMGSINYLIHYDYQGYHPQHSTTQCNTYTDVCKIQSFLTTWSSLSSFSWTSALAIYLYISVVHNMGIKAQRYFPLLHVIAWGLPIAICLPLLVVGKLGPSAYGTATWCFYQTDISKPLSVEDVTLIFVAGKFWEISTYIIVFVFYILIKRFLQGQAKGSFNPGVVAVLRRSDKKMILIPLVFVLLRSWGTIHFIFSWIIGGHSGCTTKHLYGFKLFLSVMQAIGDGGQGWGNVILYIMASDKILKKMLTCWRAETEKQPIYVPDPDEHSIDSVNINIRTYGGVNRDGASQDNTESFFEPTTT